MAGAQSGTGQRRLARWAGVMFLCACALRADAQKSESQPTMTPEQARARAATLIEQARAAIGGTASLDRILTLSTSGKTRRPVKYLSVQSPKKVVEKEKTLSGSISLDFAFPDKFRLRVKGESLRGMGFSYAQIVNGPDAWRDPPLQAISSHRDARVIDVQDFRRTELMSAQGARQQIALFLQGWLLSPMPAFPIEFSYAGEVETPMGTVEALTGVGKGGFNFYLLLDPRTHRVAGVGASFFEAIQRPILVEATGLFDRRFMQETFARARQERQARAAQPSRHLMILRFSDYRQSDGFWFPHRITTMVDDVLFEEATFEEFRLNQPIDPKKFKGPPKP